MAKTKNDNLQGTLALLVLKTLEQGPIHGWGITLHIQRISNEILRVEEGSLYPALHRMEQERWIVSEWGTSENNRRARSKPIVSRSKSSSSSERILSCSPSIRSSQEEFSVKRLSAIRKAMRCDSVR
ncbi:MAG TPA: PadR family transcriptional regulator [Candidatus Sulfotelmatobacter sp.]